MVCRNLRRRSARVSRLGGVARIWSTLGRLLSLGSATHTGAEHALAQLELDLRICSVVNWRPS